MRLCLLPLISLAACSGNEAATEEAAPVPATPPHVRAFPTSVIESDAGDPNVSIRILLSQRTVRPVHVDYLTADGSAKEAEDYRRAKGRVTFKPGITEQTIPIRIIGDQVAEGDETFLLRLLVAEYAQLDTESATITIVDDD